MGFARRGCRDVQKCVACGVRDGGWVDGSARIAFPATALDSGPTPKRRARRPARLGKEGARRPVQPLGDQTMATTSLANRSASVSSEPDATSDGHVGASLCWRYARISPGEVLPRLSGFLSGRVNPRGVPRLVKSVGRPSLVQGARACVPLSTTFVHSRRARRRRICATRRRGSGPPTARPTPNHREARRHTTRTACSAALRQSSRGPEKGPRSPVVPNSTRSHAYPTIPCHPRADPARSRGGPRWSSLVLAPCRRPSADVLARARACTATPARSGARVRRRLVP